MQMRAFMRVGSSFSDQDLGVNPSHEGACYDILSVYWYDIVGQSSKSLGTHGVCAKQFCTSIPVCPMGDLIPAPARIYRYCREHWYYSAVHVQL